MRTVLVCADDPEVNQDPTLQPDTVGSLESCLRVPFSVTKPRRFVNRATYRFHRPLWNWLNMTPDRYGAWEGTALKAIEEYTGAASYTPSIITTFSHPLVDHLVGLALKAKFNVPWIAHFSDPWTDNSFHQTDSRTRDRNLSLERAVIAGADRLIFTSQETVDLVMSKYPTEWKRKASVLPHSFDPLLFLKPSMKESSGITLRYLGSFYGERTPEPLFKAIEALLNSDPSSLSQVTFELIGDYADIENPDRLPRRLVRIKPPLPYQESLALMTSADGLLIIDAPAKLSVFLPSKLIDYVGAGRPIFGFTPPGAAANLIRELGGWVADPVGDLAPETLKYFLNFLRQRKKDESLWGDPRVRNRYEATQIARSFDAIVRELLGQ